MNEVTVVSTGNFKNEVQYGDGKSFIIDEPVELGGEDAGPDPYTLLLAALGACLSMTAMMYAKRKNWPLERVRVHLRQERIHAKDCAECEAEDKPFIHRIERRIELEGSLSEEQEARIREIAAKCPVSQTLASKIIMVDAETQA